MLESTDTKKALKVSHFAITDSGIDQGQMFNCLIEQDIIGYAGSVSPIKAEILSGEYKGSYFVGNATLDTTTKRVVVQFHRLITSTGDYTLTANVLDHYGALGLRGSHNSKYWALFFASVLSRAAQGYANAQAARQNTLLGPVITPNLENSGKIAASEAASETANLFEQELRSRPEYTRVKGPVEVQIFITKKPKRTKELLENG